MTKVILTAIAVAGLTFAGSAEARGPLEGRWAKGNMQIDIKPCGATLCGTVVRASRKQQSRAQNGSGTNLIGATLIKQIQPAGPQTYKARVFVADRNIHAAGKIRQLSANRLQVSGCALAVLCKTTQWVRVR